MKRVFGFAGVGSALLLALACGSETSSDNTVSYGGASGRGTGATGGAGPGGAGPGGAGGFGVGGAAGGITYDSGPGSDANPDAACEGIKRDVQTETLPVDIVWGIDTSGSMREES